MKYTGTESSASPSRVIVEKLPEKTMVRLADNIQELEREDGTAYVYDEVVFDLPEGRDDSVSAIEAGFSDWWAYGQEDHTPPTLEEKVNILMDAIFEEV